MNAGTASFSRRGGLYSVKLNMPRAYGLLLASLCFLAFEKMPFLMHATAYADEIRTWTDDTGTFTRKAEFQKLVNDTVHLKGVDGEVFHIPLSKLSPADRSYTEIESLLVETFTSLRNDAYVAASASLNAAASQSTTASSRLRIDQWKRLADAAKMFDSYRSRAMAALRAGNEFDVNGIALVVVEVDNDKLIYRMGGRNKTIPRNEIPVSIMEAIVTACLSNTPSKDLYLGAYHFAKNDTEKALACWGRAHRGGVDASMLLPLLGDPIIGRTVLEKSPRIPLPPNISFISPHPPAVKEKALQPQTTLAGPQFTSPIPDDDPTQAEPLPVPSEADVQEALRLIRQAYEDDYKSDFRTLIAKLHDASQQTTDPSRRFAMLQEAEQLAVKANDATIAMRLLEERGRLFDIDVQRCSIQLIALFPKPSGEQARKLIGLALTISQDALVKDQFSVATESLETAILIAKGLNREEKLKNATQKYGGSELLEEAQALQATIRDRSVFFETYQAAARSLEKNPSHDFARNNEIVGRYLCLAKNNWEEGLPYLAKGDGGQLKECALKELALLGSRRPRTEKATKELFAIAEDWWKLSEKPGRAKPAEDEPDEKKPVDKESSLSVTNLLRIREHAASLYAEALPGLLDPLDRALATKRSSGAGLAGGAKIQKATNSIGMEFVVIPKGNCLMGEGSNVVRVILTKSFLLGRYEVTQEQFKKVMDFEPWVGRGDVQIDKDNAASYVNWNDATAFCQRLTDTDHKNGKLPAGESYRLPTEAQWEYACRAGTQTKFSFGDDANQMGEYGWCDGNTRSVGQGYAHKVGMKKHNPAGLFDMHGNVFEWCSDWYGEKLSGGTDPVGPGVGSVQVVRGGGWRSYQDRCRSASRILDAPSARNGNLGFRVACSQSAAGAERRQQVTQAETTPQVATPQVAAAERPVQLEANSIGMELIEISAGKFMMGEGAGAVAVTLTRPFVLGTTEVTQGQYEKMMGTKPWAGESNVQVGKDNPATSVSWDDATEFCKKLTKREQNPASTYKLKAGEVYRLPTEAEWEYACRAGTTTAYSFGDDASTFGEYGWFSGNTAGEQYAHRVGMKKPNPWGLYDMHGNVWEWCSDWYDGTLPGGTDPVGPEGGSDRVYRGGSWWYYPATAGRRSVTTASRRTATTSLGFRVARSQSAP